MCSYTPDIAISTSSCGGTSFIPGEELTLHCNGGTQWRFNGSPVIDDDDSDMFEIISFNNPPSSILQFDPSYTNQHSGNYTCFTTENETAIAITTQSMCVCLSDCVCVCMCVYSVCIVCVSVCVCICIVCVCVYVSCVCICIVCVSVCVYVCVFGICVHMYVCVCVCTLLIFKIQ